MEHASQNTWSDEALFGAVVRSLRDRIRTSPYIGKSQVNFAYVAESLRPTYVAFLAKIHRTAGGDVHVSEVVDQIVEVVPELRSRFGMAIPEPVSGLILEMDARFGITRSNDIYHAVFETVKEAKEVIKRNGVPRGVSTSAERFVMDVTPALRGMLEIVLEQTDEEHFYRDRLQEIFRKALLASEGYNKDRFGLRELERLICP